MKPQFVYESLGKNEIRICHISSTEPFDCELIHVSIKPQDKSLRDYACLSYVWGDATDTEAILCDDQVLHITKSLKEALCWTRSHNECEYIWADQICINQANVTERNNQVQNMATIYQGAKLILIWFGQELPHTLQALDMVQKIRKAVDFEKDDDERGYEDVYNRLELTHKYARRADLPAFNDKEPWRALVKFYENPWFQRLWVIQETLATCINAPRSPGSEGYAQPGHVIIGEHKVSYFDLRVVGNWMWKNGQKCQAEWNYDSALVCSASILVVKLATIANLGARGRFNFGLLTLLQNFRSRQCADPRDKVYGLLGISDLHSHQTASMASMIDNSEANIKIDYNQTVLQVYRNAARAIIATAPKVFGQKSEGINVIGNAVPHSLEEGWPSWLPDWRRELECRNGAPVGLVCRWPAGSLAQRTHRHPDENCLTVEGIVLDTITWAHDETHHGQIMMRNDPGILGKSVELRLGECYQPSPCSKNESTSKAFVLTLTAGITLPSIVAKSADDAEDVLANTFFDFIRAYKLPYATEEEREVRQIELDKYSSLGYDSSWTTHPHRALCQRRLFTTKDGWLGLGLQDLQPGDILAIIFGLANIAILRPKFDALATDTYEYIGEAYVRGASNGELVPSFPRNEKGRVIGTKFTLR